MITTPIPRIHEPGVMQLLKSVLSPLDYLEKTRDRLGDVFYTKSPAISKALVLGSSAAVEAVFAADQNLFECGPSNQLVSPIFGSHSMLMLDGPAHAQRRKIVMPPFHGKSIQAFGNTIVAITESIIHQWPQSETFGIHQSMQEITLRVILRAIFGLTEGSRLEELRQLLCEMLDAFNSPARSFPLFFKPLQQDLGAWSPWGKFIRRKQRIFQLLSDEIREKRQHPLGHDVLSLLLAAEDDQGNSLTEAELLDELMTMLFAGHETTASSLAWAFYWIHRHPQVKEKLLAELNDLENSADLMAIAQLPYLTAVCNETLRIYPVVLFTFGRTNKAPFELLGHEIPAGTMLAPCIYLLHHHRNLYPDSKAFKPERFLERNYSPYEFIPFGGGNRRCLGYAFAQFEMKLVLATVLRQCSLQLVHDRPITPIRRGITMMPATGVPMTLNKIVTDEPIPLIKGD